MDEFDLDQLMIVAQTIYDERLEYTKLQAGLVWVAANGKLDSVGKKKQLDMLEIDKLKTAGILEVENGSG